MIMRAFLKDCVEYPGGSRDRGVVETLASWQQRSGALSCASIALSHTQRE